MSALTLHKLSGVFLLHPICSDDFLEFLFGAESHATNQSDEVDSRRRGSSQLCSRDFHLFPPWFLISTFLTLGRSLIFKAGRSGMDR